MNVNTSEKNINNLINNNNITIPKLNTNIENNDYFKNKGIIDETTIFYDFLSINVNKNRNNILKSKNFYLNDIKYYTKYNINNPNNDFFLYENIVNNYYDISNKYICDLNISNLILTLLGGAGSYEDIEKLVTKVNTVGSAAGSLFVFKGKFDAVLINYLDKTEKEKLKKIYFNE